MIEVSDLTKRYVAHTAVDQISFEVDRGEIVGFLGPNGAGKSTTIRMLTCFLTPTAGSAKIDGLDVEKDSIAVRRKIGYMPENVPLYHDMRVEEYLLFRGSLKGLSGKSLALGVGEAMETCSLSEVSRKMISTLSKGYRQRVGLADALINKPDLLILDEPTNGLDPQQIRHFRNLIKELGQRHTIFLSTHILPEVEMTCNRIIIINRGKLKASDTPENLMLRRREGREWDLLLKANPEKAASAIRKLKEVESVEEDPAEKGLARLQVVASGQGNPAESIFDLAVERQWKILEMSRHSRSLEDAFVDIVKEDGADRTES